MRGFVTAGELFAWSSSAGLEERAKLRVRILVNAHRKQQHPDEITQRQCRGWVRHDKCKRNRLPLRSQHRHLALIWLNSKWWSLDASIPGGKSHQGPKRC